MEHDDEVPPERVPLPRSDDLLDVRRASVTRDGRVRRVRRLSNWAAAALIAGVALTSGYFAHATPVTAATSVITGQPQAGAAATAGSAQRPVLVTPVATSSGSGVTVGASGSGAAGGAAGVNGFSTVSTWKDI